MADTTKIEWTDHTWAKPLRWNRDAERAGVRRRVFCASMADVFEDHPQLVEPPQDLRRPISDTYRRDPLAHGHAMGDARRWYLDHPAVSRG